MRAAALSHSFSPLLFIEHLLYAGSLSGAGEKGVDKARTVPTFKELTVCREGNTEQTHTEERDAQWVRVVRAVDAAGGLRETPGGCGV